MQQMVQQQVRVQPGGRVELVCPELEAGQTVRVVCSRACHTTPFAWQTIPTARATALQDRQGS